MLGRYSPQIDISETWRSNVFSGAYFEYRDDKKLHLELNVDVGVVQTRLQGTLSIEIKDDNKISFLCFGLLIIQLSCVVILAVLFISTKGFFIAFDCCFQFSHYFNSSVLNNIQDVMVEVLDTISRNRSSHLLKVWFGLDACEIISKSLYYLVQYH